MNKQSDRQTTNHSNACTDSNRSCVDFVVFVWLCILMMYHFLLTPHYCVSFL